MSVSMEIKMGVRGKVLHIVTIADHGLRPVKERLNHNPKD